MKKIISVVLSAAMLLGMTLTGFAAMTSDEMYEALTGVHEKNNYGSETGMLDAYKNVSPVQMDDMESKTALITDDYYSVGHAKWSTVFDTDFTNALQTLVDAGAYSTLDEAKAAAIAFIVSTAKVMSYPQDVLNTNSYFKSDLSGLLKEDLKAASDEFWAKGYVSLDDLADNKLTKDAFGRIILDLKAELIKYIKDNQSDVMNIFMESNADNFIADSKKIIAETAGKIIDNPKGEFKFAADAMASKGFTLSSGNKDSVFVKWVLKVFDFMKEVYGSNDTACLAVNTIFSGISDLRLVAGTGAVSLPNNYVSVAYNGTTEFSVKTAETIFSGSSSSINLGSIDLTSWTDAKLISKDGSSFPYATLSYNQTTGKYEIAGSNDSGSVQTGVLQLYRETDSVSGSGSIDKINPTALAELVAEFEVSVGRKNTNSNGGSGSGAPTVNNVKFVVNGETLASLNLKGNSKITSMPTPPEKEGYTFIGWSLDNKTVIDPTSVTITEDTVFYALYQKDGGGEVNPPELDKENHFAYIIGYPDGEFKPEQNITRAEAATIFCRILLEKIHVGQTYESKFIDVPTGEWYSNYIGYIEKLNIITGYENGEFRPDAYITRAEFATMASKFAEVTEGAEISFSDVPESHWAYSYIAKAVAGKWVEGYEDGSFRPDVNIKRSEAVTIVNRMLERNGDVEYIDAHTDEILTFTDLEKSFWAYYGILEATNGHDHEIADGIEKWIGLKNFE